MLFWQKAESEMNATCYFCKREPGVEQCSTCKRWVCIQCQDNHNCYPREGRFFKLRPVGVRVSFKRF
jgi:hypothetical protein